MSCASNRPLRLTVSYRPEQLILQDDPSFLPEFALPPPELLAQLKLGPAVDPLRNGDSQSLTPYGSQQHPTTPEGPVGGLILPASSSVGVGGFMIHGDNGSAGIGGPSDMLGGDELDDPGFSFDADGNLIDYEEANVIAGTPAAPRGSAMPGDAGASARVRQEHEEGLHAGAQVSFVKGKRLIRHLSPNYLFPISPATHIGHFSLIIYASPRSLLHQPSTFGSLYFPSTSPTTQRDH